jgi:hypothetical protein
MDEKQRRFWQVDTGPFMGAGGGEPAEIHLRQVSDNEFALGRSFIFVEGDRRVLVDAAHLQSSNLASIPGWLGWFMRRHGRHTPAALMHDLQVGESSTTVVSFKARTEADARFRAALRESGVPPVRARLMWTAVTFASRHSIREGTADAERRSALIDLWLIAALFGMGVLGYGFATGNVVLIALALLGPFFAAFLWGERYDAGVIAGYALPVAIGGSIPSVVAYHLYWVVERGLSPWTDERPPTFFQR